LVTLSVVPALAGAARLGQVVRGAAITADNARFMAAPLSTSLHVVSVVLFSMVGAFQFSDGLRRRWRTWHRVAGRVLLVAGLMTALTGLYMAQTYPWPESDGVAVYLERLVVGTAMLVCLVASIAAIRRRDFSAHGNWMIRAYALAMGAGTQVLTHLPWFVIMQSKPAGLPRAIMMGSAWVINALVAETVIRRCERGPKPFERLAPPRARTMLQGVITPRRGSRS
jgi:uncharacterized membrane protein